MTYIHIYDGETGRLLRSQEPAIDPLESELAGVPVYAEYPFSTEVEPPETGYHEWPYWTGEGWEVRGEWKNIEVWNKNTKSFEFCFDDELGEHQLYVPDAEGIMKFHQEPLKYVVDEEKATIVENPKYEICLEIQQLKNMLDKLDIEYAEHLSTPIEYPVTGKLYKMSWLDDSNYNKLLTGIVAGTIVPPVCIWDATGKPENMVEMDGDAFKELCSFLSEKREEAYTLYKGGKACLQEKIAEKEKEL